MDLTQIRYFLALAETLNFTRAADICHVTQPALTKSMQKLEDELGGPLLLRERGNSQLTELGRTMLPLLQQTYDAAKTAQLGAAQFHKQERAELRIGLGPWVPPAALEPLLIELVRHFPDLRISLHEAELPTINDWLIGSQIDVAFTIDDEGLTGKANRWLLFHEDMVALIHVDHTLAREAAVATEGLRDHVSVSRQPSSALPGLLQDLMAPPSHGAMTDEHLWTLLRCIRGVALSTTRRTQPADIVSRKLHPPSCIPVHLACIPGRRPTRAADAFVKLARARDWAA